MAPTSTPGTEDARRPRKARWRFGAVPVAVVAAVTLSLAPVSASTDDLGTQPAADRAVAAPAAAGLPVNASQVGAWNVGVSSLPPVAGTVAVSNLPATQTVAGTVNVGNFPAPTPPPLWQGSPYVQTEILESTPCRDVFIPHGLVLFAERIVTRVLASPAFGRFDLWVNLTPLGGFETYFHIPTTPGHPAPGPLDTYGATVDVGVPVTEMELCSDTTASGAIVTVFGYLVPAP
ncbi:MAG: hypothetical protein ACRD29_12735 [Acidimicrobiales bacterium]